MRRAWLALLFCVGLAGCGNAQPTIADAKLSNASVSRGLEFFITLVDVQDPDGDVYRGKVKVKMKSMVDGDVELKEELLPRESHEATKGDVIFGIRLFGSAPLGEYVLEVVFEDEGGADSEPVVLQVTVTR